jgi:formate dehydrogenase subunit gamma
MLLVQVTAAIFAIAVWVIHVYAAIGVRGTIRATAERSCGWAWRHRRNGLRPLAAEIAARSPRNFRPTKQN